MKKEVSPMCERDREKTDDTEEVWIKTEPQGIPILKHPAEKERTGEGWTSRRKIKVLKPHKAFEGVGDHIKCHRTTCMYSFILSCFLSIFYS